MESDVMERNNSMESNGAAAHRRERQAAGDRCRRPHAMPEAGHRWQGLIVWGLLCLLLAVPVSAGFGVFIQILFDQENGVSGLDGPHGVVTSPDGAYVYVASRIDDAVAVFRRSAATGKLSFVGALQNGDDAFGLDGAVALAASPDQRHVYVASFDDDSLVVLRRDATVDMLAFADVESNGVGGVFGLDGANDVAVTPDDLHVAVASVEDDALALFRRDPSRDHLQLVDLEQKGFGLQGASSVALDPLGRFAYVTAYDDDAISIFRRDASLDGFTLADVVTKQDSDGLDGAIDIDLSPDGQNAYLAAYRAGTITAFSRSPVDGSIAAIQHIDSTTLPIGGARRVEVSRDGRSVVLAARDALVFFDRLADGRLRLAGLLDMSQANGSFGGHAAGGSKPTGIALSPDSRHLYLVLEENDALAGLQLHAAGLFSDGFESGDTSAWGF